MMKILLFLLLIVLLIGTGCHPQKTEYKYDDTFIKDQDYQFDFCDIYTGKTIMQKGNSGYYFSLNNFLYFADESTMQVMPLCNQSDCLHDKETNTEKSAKCNAYLENSMLNSNFFCQDDKLFKFVDESYYEGNKLIVVNSVYETELDGTDSNKLFSLNRQIIRWMIHRGVIYYTTSENNVIEGYNLSTGKTHTVVDLDSLDLYMPYLENMTAYANKLYFFVNGYESEKEFNEFVNGKNNTAISNIFIYDIRDEKLTKITSKISRDGIVYQGFCDDCMLYSDANYDDNIKFLYALNQNGESEKLEYEFDSVYDLYCTDGNLKYIKSGKTPDELEKNIYKIYDKNNKYITTVDFPDGYANMLFLGDSKNLFYLQDTESGLCLYYIDKDDLEKGNVQMKQFFTSEN